MRSLLRVCNHSIRSCRRLLSYHLLRSNQEHERLHDEVRSEDKGVRFACARDGSDSHQRGIPTNECAVERKNILDGRAAIFESSTGMKPSQLGRNKTYLNTATPSRFSIVALLGQKGFWNVFDRVIDGRIRDCSCSDKFVVTNCIENATSNRRSDQEVFVESLAETTHSWARSSKPPGSSRVNVLGSLSR
jgi:hypothetical protein